MHLSPCEQSSRGLKTSYISIQRPLAKRRNTHGDSRHALARHANRLVVRALPRVMIIGRTGPETPRAATRWWATLPAESSIGAVGAEAEDEEPCVGGASVVAPVGKVVAGEEVTDAEGRAKRRQARRGGRGGSRSRIAGLGSVLLSARCDVRWAGCI